MSLENTIIMIHLANVIENIEARNAKENVEYNSGNYAVLHCILPILSRNVNFGSCCYSRALLI